MSEGVNLESGVHETKYMTFRLATLKSGQKQTWDVLNKAGNYLLGELLWYAAWRQYVFRPCLNTEFNKSCLDDIAEVLEALNKGL